MQITCQSLQCRYGVSHIHTSDPLGLHRGSCQFPQGDEEYGNDDHHLLQTNNIYKRWTPVELLSIKWNWNYHQSIGHFLNVYATIPLQSLVQWKQWNGQMWIGVTDECSCEREWRCGSENFQLFQLIEFRICVGGYSSGYHLGRVLKLFGVSFTIRHFLSIQPT